MTLFSSARSPSPLPMFDDEFACDIFESHAFNSASEEDAMLSSQRNQNLSSPSSFSRTEPDSDLSSSSLSPLCHYQSFIDPSVTRLDDTEMPPVDVINSLSNNRTTPSTSMNTMPCDQKHFKLSNYLDGSRLTTNCAQPISEDGLQIRVIGAPSKSRVETQIRLCIQLLTSAGATKVSSWPYLKLPERLLARSRLKRSAQKTAIERGRMLLSDESRILYLDARVACATKPNAPVKVCAGCIQRERKRAERSKNSNKSQNQVKNRSIIDDIPEQDRILLFNCGPMLNFSSGDAILPTRITCYCRHHNEKLGFCIHFTARNDQGMIIASGVSPPILITDDHKSSMQKGRKRVRSEIEPTEVKSRSRQRTESLASTALNTPAPSRRGSVSDNGSSDLGHPLLADPGALSVLDSFTALPTPSEESEPSCLFGDADPSSIQTFFPLEQQPDPAPSSSEQDREQQQQSSYGGSGRRASVVPQLERLVPPQGPTHGGVEVTILGSGFYRGLTCLFGEHAAATVYWNPNTLVCVLPPAAHPGPVVVSFKQHPLVLDGQEVPLFTYYDANDQALLELALQIVGLKMTGKLHDAKHIAMRILHGDYSQSSCSHTGSTLAPQQSSFLSHTGSLEEKIILALQQFDISDVSHTNASRHTMLHLATLLQYQQLVEELVARWHSGSSLDVKDRNGFTPLQLACWKRHFAIANILMQAGSDPHLACGLFGGKTAWELLKESDDSTFRSFRRRSSGPLRCYHCFQESSIYSSCNSSVSDLLLDGSFEQDVFGVAKGSKPDRRLYAFWLPLLIGRCGNTPLDHFGNANLSRQVTVGFLYSQFSNIIPTMLYFTPTFRT